MGMGAVAGVVGVAQGVASMAQGAQQRKIADAQAMANQKAAEASAAMRKIQISTSRDYANYNANLNSLTRQFQLMQGTMGNQAQGILDTMNYNAQMGQLGMADIGNQMGLTEAGMQSDQMRAGAEQSALQQRSEASNQSTQTQNQLTNAGQATGQQQQQGDARRAMLQTMMAASGGAPGQTEMALQGKDINNQVAQVLAQSLQQEGISAQDLQTLLYSRDIADISKRLGINAADYLQKMAEGNAMMNQTSIDAKRKDAGLTNQMATAGRDTSMKMLNFAQSSDANADEVNKIFAEAGFQQQSNASNIQLSSQLASINASRASTANSSPGLFDYLGMGLKAYSSLSGAGLFGGGTSTASQGLNQGSYSIFSGGYNMTPFTGAMSDPSSYSAAGAGFTSLAL